MTSEYLNLKQRKAKAYIEAVCQEIRDHINKGFNDLKTYTNISTVEF